jgi:aminoacyl-tRNA hydrolase
MTRHNVGWLAMDEIHSLHDASQWTEIADALVADAQIDGMDALLVKPLTYMNDSGRAVRQAMQHAGLESPSDVVVLHDDLDLAPAQVKVKTGGRHGGHNGLRSIDDAIGTDYVRVRLGIGHPRRIGVPVVPYVLGSFSEPETRWMEPLVEVVGRHVGDVLSGNAGIFLATVQSLDLQSMLGHVDASSGDTVEAARQEWHEAAFSAGTTLSILSAIVRQVEEASIRIQGTGMPHVLVNASDLMLASLDRFGPPLDEGFYAPLAKAVDDAFLDIASDCSTFSGVHAVPVRRRLEDIDLHRIYEWSSRGRGKIAISRRDTVQGRLVALTDGIGPRLDHAMLSKDGSAALPTPEPRSSLPTPR